jgi:hypothetical protein
MLNLFLTARTNAGRVVDKFEAMLADMPGPTADLVREFASWVHAESLISINTKLYIVIDLINGGNYKSTYTWADEQSRLSGRNVEQVLRERLGEYYEKRVMFDRAFEKGERFVYGALNAGGVALTSFDQYCVVLKHSFQSGAEKTGEIACLPGDSLKICFSDEGLFDQSAVESGVAPFSQRHRLAASERASEVSIVEKQEWPTLVVSPTRYFEVIFIGKISIESVDSVRLKKEEYDTKWDLCFLNLGSKRNEAERALVSDFIQLRRAELDGR